METRLRVDIQPQPDDVTCGPTCLDAVYRYYGDALPLEQVIAEVPCLDDGGRLIVQLACHALKRGYDATIYTYNLQVFDPTWFDLDSAELQRRLLEQTSAKLNPKLAVATGAYLEFLKGGGRLRFQDLTTSLIRKYLNRGKPVITGLSATYLHRTAREFGPELRADDIRGYPTGHFVVLCGYDKARRQVLVADPLESNPLSDSNYYQISIDRVMCAILLGIVTYDANLLIIEPRAARKHGRHANPDRREQ